MGLFRRKKSEETEKIIAKVKEEKLDFSGLFSNLNNRKEIDALYTELSRSIHPDKFVGNPEKENLANKLFQRLQENSTNLLEMQKIKKQSKELLGI